MVARPASPMRGGGEWVAAAAGGAGAGEAIGGYDFGAGGGGVVEEERRWEAGEERMGNGKGRGRECVGDRNIARGFGWGPWGLRQF